MNKLIGIIVARLIIILLFSCIGGFTLSAVWNEAISNIVLGLGTMSWLDGFNISLTLFVFYSFFFSLSSQPMDDE